MIDISKLRIGDKVHYVPFEGCDETMIENGVVKEIPENSLTEVRVVYNCAGEWENFKNYTSQLTPIKKLKMGWYY
jgi:hypothetical protein